MNDRIAPEHVHNAPTTNVGDNSPQANASIQDRAGLYIAIVALVMAALSIGLFLEQRSSLERERRLQEQLVSEKIARGIAEARAVMQEQVADAKMSFQEQVAEAKSVANTGREHARIGLAEVQRANAQLEAKGLITPRTH